MKNCFYFVCILLIIATAGCDVLHDPVFENPADPNSKYFRGEPSYNLSVENITASVIQLRWINSSRNVYQNIIQRKAGNSTYTEIGRVSGSDTTFTDTLSQESEIYSYRIFALFASGYSSLSQNISIKQEYSFDTLKLIPGISAFKLSNDGSLLSVTEPGYVNKIYDVKDGYSLVCGFSGSPGIMAITNDNSRIIGDNVIKKVIEVRDIASGSVLQTYGREYDVNAIAVSPDSRFLITADGFQTYIRNLETGAIEKQFKNSDEWFYSPVKFFFSNNGRYLANVNISNSVTLRDTDTWAPIQNFSGAANTYFTKDSRFLIFTQYYSYSYRYVVWDMERSEFITKRYNGVNITVAPDEKTAITYYNWNGGNIEVWSMDGMFPKEYTHKLYMKSTIKEIVISKLNDIYIHDFNNQLTVLSGNKIWMKCQ